MPRLLAYAAGVACTLLAACGGGAGGGGNAAGGSSCSDSREKRFVHDVAREWYLFRDLLPADIGPGDFATVQELLDALTAEARAQGKDRYFSFLTTRQADDSFFVEGQFVGFGFRSRIETDRLWVTDVFEGSPAADAGLERGVEITEIDAGDGFVPVATVLAEDPELEQVLGPATVGVVRGLRFVTLAGETLEASLVKAVIDFPPLPGGAAVLALPANPSVPVGYLHLRTFITTAEAPLRDAYAAFRAQNVEYFVFDLRYNSGGLLSVAELVGDLNGAARDESDVFLEMRFNERKSGNDVVRRFLRQSESVAPVRIAFITTGLTASASEIVINSLAPWTEVAIVGEDTLGKPVGQSGFDLSGCDLRLRLVAVQFTNSEGRGEYYDGLAATLPFACAAEDDLTHAPGDPAESSTAEALAWLGTGACTVVLGPESRPRKARAGIRIPAASRPTPAQMYLPGIF